MFAFIEILFSLVLKFFFRDAQNKVKFKVLKQQIGCWIKYRSLWGFSGDFIKFQIKICLFFFHFKWLHKISSCKWNQFYFKVIVYVWIVLKENAIYINHLKLKFLLSKHLKHSERLTQFLIFISIHIFLVVGWKSLKILKRQVIIRNPFKEIYMANQQRLDIISQLCVSVSEKFRKKKKTTKFYFYLIVLFWLYFPFYTWPWAPWLQVNFTIFFFFFWKTHNT